MFLYLLAFFTLPSLMCARTHLVIFKCCTFRTQTPMRTVGDWTGTKLQALVDDVLPSRKVPESDARSVGGCSYKYHFCRDKHVFVTTNICLPWQNFCSDYIMLVVTKYFCHDKMFVVTNICHDQTCVCCDIFVVATLFFLVTTSILFSWQHVLLEQTHCL